MPRHPRDDRCFSRSADAQVPDANHGATHALRPAQPHVEAERAYEASRAVTVGTLTQRTAIADYNGQQYSGYFEGGYSFFYKNLRMTPLVSFQYMHLHTASYTEDGAGALNLSVASQDYDMAMTSFGMLQGNVSSNLMFFKTT